jgi:hypothetical protein
MRGVSDDRASALAATDHNTLTNQSKKALNASGSKRKYVMPARGAKMANTSRPRRTILRESGICSDYGRAGTVGKLYFA